MARNLLLVASSMVLSALILEAVLRLFYAPPPIWREPQTRHLDSPLLGWVLPVRNESYTIEAPVRTNSLGLRDDEIPLRKPPGERRILCLGDSFTFALGVRFEDLYVQQLERMLNERHAPTRFQVINAAVAGYNTRQELLYLLAQGFDLEPDVITVGFYWNDVLGNEAPLPDVETTPLRTGDGRLREDRHHTLPPWIRDRLRQSLLLYIGVTRAKRLTTLFNPPTHTEYRVQRALLLGDHERLEPFWKATEQRLLELASAARERGVPVVLLVFPMENQIRHEFPDLVFVDRLREIWKPTNMPLVDVEPLYRAAPARGVNPFLPYDLHPGAAGMRIAAEAVYEALVLHRLLEPRATAESPGS